MYIGPDPAHRWVSLFAAVAQADTETLSAGIKLFPALRNQATPEEIMPGAMGIELYFTMNSAGTTDNLRINHYPAREGDKTNYRSSVSISPRTIDCTSGNDVIVCYGLTWEDLDNSSGLVIGIDATGATDVITVTADYRRLRIGNPLSM